MGNGNYLMIETGGKAVAGEKSAAQNPVRLRFNVNEVEKAAEELTEKGAAVNLRREQWGTVAEIVDPDGNICSLRDETRFGQ